MLFRKLTNWTNLAHTKGLLFFVQRLDELTFPYSLDSYKASTTGIITLVDEALELLNDSHVLSGNFGAVKHVLDELGLRLKGNFVAKEVFNLDIDSVLSGNLEGNVKGTIRRLKVFRSEMDPETYLGEITHLVISHNQEKPKKSQLELLAREFASLLQYLGVSRDHINSSLINAFYGESEIRDTTSFREFCKAVYPHAHKFRVGITVSESIKDVSFDVLRSNNILPYSLLKDDFDEDDKVFVEALECYQKTNDGELLICHVSAPDANAAATMATKSITEAISFQKLFYHKLEVNIASTAVTEQSCCAEDIRTVLAFNNHMHFIRDMKAVKAIGVAKRCHEELSLDIGPDARKFANIVNMHGVSLSSTSNDVQIVNLWTCIETLVPSEQIASKISNAVKRISPILALGYYNRLTMTLLTDLLRWDKYCLSAILKKSKVDDSLPLFEKFIQLLREEVNDADLRELLDKCRNFELLRYRVTSIAELLRDPEKARVRLEQHERLVNWQFYRIYRCSNGIVHAGESPNHTKYLVENAHDYFDQALNFCVEVSSWKSGFNTFESCFDFATSEYQQYIRNMKSDRTAIVWRIPKQRGRSFIFQDSLK